MRKNIIWILLIFLVPLCAYFGLTRDRMTTLPASAAGDELIKFSSPMCQECLELEKVMNKVMPEYNDRVSLRIIDVTNRNNDTQALIKEYSVKLVPTTVFKNQDGKVLRRIEGSMEPEVLRSYLEELINE